MNPLLTFFTRRLNMYPHARAYVRAFRGELFFRIITFLPSVDGKSPNSRAKSSCLAQIKICLFFGTGKIECKSSDARRNITLPQQLRGRCEIYVGHGTRNMFPAVFTEKRHRFVNRKNIEKIRRSVVYGFFCLLYGNIRRNIPAFFYFGFVYLPFCLFVCRFPCVRITTEHFRDVIAYVIFLHLSTSVRTANRRRRRRRGCSGLRRARVR